jgi:hypothetical protein
VRSLGRAWESFRGGSGGSVRVYVPVLGGPVDLVAMAGGLSAAVAAAGACCVVVPVPADPALADPRQAAVARAATEVWPTPEPTAAPEPVHAATPEPVVSDDVVEAAEPVVAEEPAVTEEPGPPVAGDDGPGDAPGAAFELIAANLQWSFDSGSEQDDPVDAALRGHAEQSRRTAALFRTWVHDPAGSWVRVVLGYVNRGSIADVESERTALVDTLQKAGAARCCVEVLAASDVTDAHRWLEARCRPLWTPAPPAPEDPAAVEGAAQVDRLPDGATFRPGPGLDDAEHGGMLTGLVDWATGRPDVVGLVTAYTGEGRLVVGVALDAEADPGEVGATAPSPVEPFAPARGLDPVHLRLSRSSTRVWTRRAERAQPEPTRPSAGTLQRPDLPAVVDQGPPPTRDTEDPRVDVTVDGFVLVGIDRDTTVGKGEPRPDDHDAALVEFARAKAGAIALVRGVTEDGLKVFCLAVEETVDPEAARRELATAAAAAGLTRAAVEAFAPAGAISAFHLDLAVGSTRLWPTRS